MNFKPLRPMMPWLLASFLATCSPAGAQTFEPEPSGPFCGINCLYTALRTEGLDVDLAALMQSRYVGSDSGSSIAELLSAAQDNHAYVKALANLSVADLRHLQSPAILHVKSAYDALEYDHFVLCVPVEGKLCFYDPPNQPGNTSGHELAALWDGTAIVVSARPIDLRALRLWAGVRAGLMVMPIHALAGMGFLIQSIHRRRHGQWSLRLGPLRQCVLVTGTGAMLAAGYHLLAPEGFAAQRQALVTINHSRFDPPPTRIGLREAQRLLTRGATFVDARRAGDFAEGHISGAINLPPNASRTEIQAALGSRAEDRSMVIYCANPSCPYADHLARRLRRYGYENLKVFTGGYSQWQPSTIDGVQSAKWSLAGMQEGT
jgi:rhodanese-related sulfurtransferase